MIWIVSAGIDKTETERRARLQYIKEVSGDKYISWEKKQGISPLGAFEYYQCLTNDGINGTFITAHNFTVAALCTQWYIAQSDFVVANTCKVMPGFDKLVLELLQRLNVSAKLYYAKQEKEMIKGIEYDSNIIRDVGLFGFLTSHSERMLYLKKEKGLMDALKTSFDNIEVEGN